MFKLEWRMELAKNEFKRWEKTQNELAGDYDKQIEQFFSRYIYREIDELQHIESEAVGDLVKHLMQLANTEIERAQSIWISRK